MDITAIIATGLGCAIIAFFIGRLSATGAKFDPFVYYRSRVRQLTDTAEKQSDLQSELRKLDQAFTYLFPDTKN